MSLPCLNLSMASQCPPNNIQIPDCGGPCLFSLLQFLAPWFLSHSASSTFSQFTLTLSPLAGNDSVCWSSIQLSDYLIFIFFLMTINPMKAKAMSILLTTCLQANCLVCKRCSMFVELIND